VAQPFDRSTDVPPAGKLDSAAGQFWVGNPWDIVYQGHNLSAHERNRTFLNLGAGRFVDVSFLTGSDSDGDGRAAVAADLDADGMQDLVVRQAGGGPLLVFRNRFPRKNYLKITLRGVRSNALGVGAKLVAEVGGRRMVREMYPINSFASQAPTEAYFGLGDASQVDRLTVRWPSGVVQQLNAIEANQRIEVVEGEPSETLVPESSKK
jgi:hypothetical protein